MTPPLGRRDEGSEKETTMDKKNEAKKNLKGRVLGRVLAEELQHVTGGDLILTRANGHLDATDSRSDDSLQA